MRKITLLTYSLIGLLGASPVWAAEDSVASAMAQEYVAALRSGDDGTIERAWKKMDADPRTLAEVQKTFPVVYSSYKLQGSALRAKAARAEYDRRAAEEEKQAAATPQPQIPLEPEIPEIIRPSPNQDFTRLFPNGSGTPNQEIVRDFPNQLRISNQDSIASRLPDYLQERDKTFGINPMAR